MGTVGSALSGRKHIPSTESQYSFSEQTGANSAIDSNLDCSDPIRYWGGPTGYPGTVIDLVVGQHSETTPDNDRGGKSFFCI